MTILLFVALGISLLCTVTLVGACVVSGQNRQSEEEGGSAHDDEQWQRIASSATKLTITSLS